MEKWELDFNLITWEIKRISEYTSLSFSQVKELPYCEYLLYRKESWIASWMHTEEGREFLKTIWRLQQTKADTTAIHQFQNRGCKGWQE